MNFSFSSGDESLKSYTFRNQNAEGWRTLQRNNVGFFQGRGDQLQPQPLPTSICPLIQATGAGIYCQANEIQTVQPPSSSITVNGARFACQGEQIQDLTASVSSLAGNIHAMTASSISLQPQSMAGCLRLTPPSVKRTSVNFQASLLKIGHWQVSTYNNTFLKSNILYFFFCPFLFLFFPKEAKI